MHRKCGSENVVEFGSFFCDCDNSQIDPDERPRFDEAVRILEQTEVPREEVQREGGGEDEDLRACFSEPLLRYCMFINRRKE